MPSRDATRTNALFSTRFPFLLALGLWLLSGTSTFAQAPEKYPDSYELLCPAGSVPIAGPTGNSFNQSTGKFRADFCMNPFGSMSFRGIAGDYLSVIDFGAKCDGVSDDTAAFQAALNAANSSGGGTVIVPPGPNDCFLTATTPNASVLNMDGFHGVTLQSAANGPYITGPNPNRRLVFTGNPTTSYISARSTYGVSIQHLFIQYTNTSFTGLVVDTSHSGLGTDTQHFLFYDNAVSGTASANNAACEVCLDLNDTDWIIFNSFLLAKVGVRGANGASASNQVNVIGNLFGLQPLPFGTASIQNPGQGWKIQGNTFELTNTVSSFNIIDGSNCSSCGNGIEITANWFGDASANWTGTIFFQIGNGISIKGNRIGMSSAATIANLQASAAGFDFEGNNVVNYGTGFVFGASDNNVTIDSNSYSGVVGTFSTGAPISGRIRDFNGNVNEYRTSQTSFYASNGTSLIALVDNNGNIRGQMLLANTGTFCSNGELALSAGWGTGAVATAVLGTGQTCKWTITSGTGPTANPTITDTLTNSILGGANTVCRSEFYNPATGAQTASENTTLSTTAPVFTVYFTPAASTAYRFERTCGP